MSAGMPASAARLSCCFSGSGSPLLWSFGESCSGSAFDTCAPDNVLTKCISWVHFHPGKDDEIRCLTEIYAAGLQPECRAVK